MPPFDHCLRSILSPWPRCSAIRSSLGGRKGAAVVSLADRDRRTVGVLPACEHSGPCPLKLAKSTVVPGAARNRPPASTTRPQRSVQVPCPAYLSAHSPHLKPDVGRAAPSHFTLRESMILVVMTLSPVNPNSNRLTRQLKSLLSLPSSPPSSQQVNDTRSTPPDQKVRYHTHEG